MQRETFATMVYAFMFGSPSRCFRHCMGNSALQKDACLKNSCENNATCQIGFTDKGYRCVCAGGFKGTYCRKDINECVIGTHKCSAVAVCYNTKGSYTCTCKPGYYGDGRYCEAVSTCKDIYDKKISYESRAYSLHVENQTFKFYCHMNMTTTGNGACGDGGWTLVMKINGSKKTFHYDSECLSNKSTFNLGGGETGFDYNKTKLPTYWNTPFSKICLGMKIDQQINFIVIKETASSLYSVIADGEYRKTTLSRDMWKSLIGPEGSLQKNCNTEGFNVRCGTAARARIGILSNQECCCDTCDSLIGFGTERKNFQSITCGNKALFGGDNGDKHIEAMGFIFVQ